MKTLLITFCVLIHSASAVAGPWPQIEHPADALVDAMGSQIRLNGIPMQMVRARSNAGMDAMLAHYRAALGIPVAHARVADTHLLSQKRGGHFITVSISATDDGLSEALLSIADMQAAAQAASRPQGFTLPTGSTVLSDMESADGERNARQWVLLNTHSLRTNLAHLSRGLVEHGLMPDGPPLTDTTDVIAQGFQGAMGEAHLILMRHEGATHVVLTLILKRT